MTAVLRGDPGLRNPTPCGKMDPRRGAALIALEALLVIIAFAPVFVSAQPGASRLTWSIDCGSDRNYTDPITSIIWTVDDPFIRTGENARNVAVVQGKDPLVNKRQLGTLRYFNDSSRTRHCYVLPVTPRTTYLVRPTFFLGNWMNSTAENIVFSLSINATWWLKIYLSSSVSDHNRTQFFEAIVHSPGSVLNICLWPIEKPHIAFISTLELREFTTGMYTSASAGGYQYQSLHTRINPGPTPTTGNENLRYPDDPYDRIWWADGSYPLNQVSRKNNASGSSSSLQLQNKPPSVVMDDAWTGTTNQTFSYSSGNVGYIFGSIVIYIYAMMFDAISNSSNIMQYSVNGIPVGAFTASNFPQEIISSIIVPESNYTINFTLTDSSTVSILNAFEVYLLRDLDRSFTSRTDVDSITAVQKALDLTNWTGDPCLPKEYPYEWLSCDNSSAASASDSAYTGFTTAPEYRITTLHLNNLMMDATEIAPPEIASLTALNHLELKGNGFSNLSISLSQLKNLTWLDLSNNHFSGEVVQLLRSVGVNDNLQQLNLDGNGFTKFSSGSHSFHNLTTLNVSNNRLEGNVMDFVNSISSSDLTFLYAANNSLQGRLSTAQLNQRFKDIREVDFDGQSISGTVNLSDWHLTWQSPGQNSSKRVTQLIKLRWNNITDVYPDLDNLSTSIKDAHDSPAWGTTLDKNGDDVGGVLLSGNPWCWTSDNKTLAHRYFCRHDQSVAVNYSSTGLPVPTSKDTNKTAVILGTTVGGCSLLICCIIILGIMWRKLRKKSRALSEIHEAFIKEKVHPPIYSYAELRTATKNFSSENNLGRGAFGAVYRGKLVNGTQVAVKKLFKESQVLDEFLNEAVLITGIKHRNLSQLKGCCIDHDQRILVYEYAENGNLAEALWGKSSMGKKIEYQNETSLSWQKRLNICMGIARGLSYLHEELQPPIIHRDIKPANILIDRNFDAKIADFGLARSFLSEKTRADFTRNVAGTFGYLAPEYVTQGQLTEKADVFSFGVVLLEIVSGRKCIDESLPIERVSLVHWASTVRDEGNVLDILDPSIQLSSNDEEVLRVVDIAFACLQINPARRPTMLQTVARMHGDASAVFNLSRTSLLSPNELKKSSVDWFRLNPSSRHHHTLSH